MRLRKRFCNCQSEPEPAETPLKRAVTCLEALENTFHHFRFDPDPGVGHTDSQTLWRLIPRRNRDRASFPCKLDRILYQIPNDLLKLGSIRRDVVILCAEVEGEVQML